MLSKGAYLHTVNDNFESALFQFSTAKVAEVLLVAGINANNGLAELPIISALLARYDGDEKLEILQLLINYGAKVGDELYGYSKETYPILYARSKEEVDILLSAGAVFIILIII